MVEAHPKVEKVVYPGLDSFHKKILPTSITGMDCMAGCFGLMSLVVTKLLLR